MLKHFFALTLISLATCANAQIYKCQGTDGKTQFSDTACKAGNTSEIVPDRAPVTEQQQYEAEQRAKRAQAEATARNEDLATAPAESQTQTDRSRSETDAVAAETKAVTDESDATASCARDVERRGASQEIKAEMIAACRSAGTAQRSAGIGISHETVRSCIRDVERTGASENDKARQLAICHGADVQLRQWPSRRR